MPYYSNWTGTPSASSRRAERLLLTKLRRIAWLDETSLTFDHDGFSVSVKLRTTMNEYLVVAIAPKLPRRKRTGLGYLGATAMQWRGKDKGKGNDLADGPFNDRTWTRIIHDMIGFEMIR